MQTPPAKSFNYHQNLNDQKTPPKNVDLSNQTYLIHSISSLPVSPTAETKKIYSRNQIFKAKLRYSPKSEHSNNNENFKVQLKPSKAALIENNDFLPVRLTDVGLQNQENNENITKSSKVKNFLQQMVKQDYITSMGKNNRVNTDDKLDEKLNIPRDFGQRSSSNPEVISLLPVELPKVISLDDDQPSNIPVIQHRTLRDIFEEKIMAKSKNNVDSERNITDLKREPTSLNDIQDDSKANRDIKNEESANSIARPVIEPAFATKEDILMEKSTNKIENELVKPLKIEVIDAVTATKEIPKQNIKEINNEILEPLKIEVIDAVTSTKEDPQGNINEIENMKPLTIKVIDTATAIKEYPEANVNKFENMKPLKIEVVDAATATKETYYTANFNQNNNNHQQQPEQQVILLKNLVNSPRGHYDEETRPRISSDIFDKKSISDEITYMQNALNEIIEPKSMHDHLELALQNLIQNKKQDLDPINRIALLSESRIRSTPVLETIASNPLRDYDNNVFSTFNFQSGLQDRIDLSQMLNKPNANNLMFSNSQRDSVVQIDPNFSTLKYFEYCNMKEDHKNFLATLLESNWFLQKKYLEILRQIQKETPIYNDLKTILLNEAKSLQNTYRNQRNDIYSLYIRRIMTLKSLKDAGICSDSPLIQRNLPIPAPVASMEDNKILLSPSSRRSTMSNTSALKMKGTLLEVVDEISRVILADNPKSKPTSIAKNYLEDLKSLKQIQNSLEKTKPEEIPLDLSSAADSESLKNHQKILPREILTNFEEVKPSFDNNTNRPISPDQEMNPNEEIKLEDVDLQDPESKKIIRLFEDTEKEENFDVLNTEREGYAKPPDEESIIEEIRNQSNIHNQPNIVEDSKDHSHRLSSSSSPSSSSSSSSRDSENPQNLKDIENKQEEEVEEKDKEKEVKEESIKNTKNEKEKKEEELDKQIEEINEESPKNPRESLTEKIIDFFHLNSLIHKK